MTKQNMTQLVAGLMLMLAATTGWAEDEGVVRLGGAGVVRIKDGQTTPASSQAPTASRPTVVRGQTPEQMISNTGVEPTSLEVFDYEGFEDAGGWYSDQAAQYRSRNAQTSYHLQSRVNPDSYTWTGQYCPPGYPHGFHRAPGPAEYHVRHKVTQLKYWLGGQAAIARQRRAASDATLTGYLKYKYGYFHPTGCGGKGCPPFGHYSMVYPLDAHAKDARDGQLYAAEGYNGPVAVPLAPNVRHTYNYGWGIPSSRLTPTGNVATGQ